MDDNIVINILKEKMKQPESEKGVILDGVPRTLAQLDLYEKAGLKTDLVINITLNQSVLLEKLIARRVLYLPHIFHPINPYPKIPNNPNF